MTHPNLYRVVEPKALAPDNPVHAEIAVIHGYDALFTTGQIARMSGRPRRQVERKIRQLVKRGAVMLWGARNSRKANKE